jgi:ribose transport system substrate-binding protein
MKHHREAPGRARGRRPGPRPPKKAVLASVSAFALVAAVAACSSGSSSSSSSAATSTATSSATTAATASATASTAAGVAYAQAQIQAAMAAPAAPVPSTAISGLSSLRGKTIYYVPISSDVPAFAITAAAMKTALASVGVNLEVCSGNFNPSQFAACFSQAIGAGAAAIVSDAIPYQITASLIEKASAKGIGVVVTDQTPLPGRPEGKNIAYIPGNNNQYQLTQDWIIANSNGNADVLELEATDSPTSLAATADFAIPELQKYCPSCKETLLKFTSSNEQDLPSLISAALLKDPNINYISPQYDQYVSFVIQGIQDAQATGRVKMAASAAALSGLQDVNTPSSTVKAEVADNQVYNGWIDADEAMRMALGQAAVSYSIPVRLFTSANISGIQLNNAGMASGSWFGSTSYEQQFKTLWGVS